MLVPRVVVVSTRVSTRLPNTCTGSRSEVRTDDATPPPSARFGSPSSLESSGKVTAAKADVLTRLRPHLDDRALGAAVRRVAALDLRGNAALQNQVQAAVMTEVERVAGDIGLMVRAVSLKWAFNEDEIAAIAARNKTRLRDAQDQDAALLQRAISREGETTYIRISTDLSVEKARQASDTELRRLILADELGFIDARDTGRRIAELKELQHQIDLVGKERLNALAAEIQAVQHAASMARQRGLQIVAEQETLRTDVSGRTDLAKRQGELETALRAIRLAQAQFEVVELEFVAKKSSIQRDIIRADEEQKIHLAALVRKKQFEDLKDLGGLEHDGKDRDLDRDLKRKESEARAKIELIKAYRDMPVDLVKTLEASTSALIANVMIEEVRAGGANAEGREALLREMVAQARAQSISTEEQARTMAAMIVQGSTGVAQGVGSAMSGTLAAQRPAAAAAPTVNAAKAPTRDCPSCNRPVKISAKVCPHADCQAVLET